MPGISRCGVDTAGSTIIGPGSSNVFVNGSKTVLIGDNVKPHPPSPSPHSKAPKMVTASSTVFANGKPVVRSGDLASCSHSATGSSNVYAGWRLVAIVIIIINFI